MLENCFLFTHPPDTEQYQHEYVGLFLSICECKSNIPCSHKVYSSFFLRKWLPDVRNDSWEQLDWTKTETKSELKDAKKKEKEKKKLCRAAELSDNSLFIFIWHIVLKNID